VSLRCFTMSRLGYERPLELLARLRDLGVEVLVKLKDGSEYVGRIESADLSMNIILGDAVQVGEDGNPLVNYGRIFIRGSNIVFVAVRDDKIVI